MVHIHMYFHEKLGRGLSTCTIQYLFRSHKKVVQDLTRKSSFCQRIRLITLTPCGRKLLIHGRWYWGISLHICLWMDYWEERFTTVLLLLLPSAWPHSQSAIMLVFALIIISMWKEFPPGLPGFPSSDWGGGGMILIHYIWCKFS